jgi:hypothetical protein
MIRIDEREESSLDIEPVDVDNNQLDDIISAIRESRER